MKKQSAWHQRRTRMRTNLKQLEMRGYIDIKSIFVKYFVLDCDTNGRRVNAQANEQYKEYCNEASYEVPLEFAPYYMFKGGPRGSEPEEATRWSSEKGRVLKKFIVLY